jgi:hypothetical protein
MGVVDVDARALGRGVAHQHAKRRELSPAVHEEASVGVAKDMRVGELRRDAGGQHDRFDDLGERLGGKAPAGIGKAAVTPLAAQARKEQRISRDLRRPPALPLQKRGRHLGRKRKLPDSRPFAVNAKPGRPAGGGRRPQAGDLKRSRLL